MTATRLNPLPAPTWNRLGVNQAEIALPAVPAAGWGESRTGVDAPAGQIHSVCPGFSALDSGSGDLDGFLRENANFHLHLMAEGTADRPVLIQHLLDDGHPHALAHITLEARPGSRITLIEVVRGEAGVHGSLTEIHGGAGAQVRLIQLQLLGQSARSWSAAAVSAEDSACVKLYRAVLGGESALCGSRCNLSGAGSSYSVQNIYYGDGDRLLDFSDTAVHTGRETVSEIHAAGVLGDRCRKILRGTIDFRRGAVNARGRESEDVLLLSPEVRNRTAPLILCGEEQVEGQHAASVGRLDDGMLYYMAARGIGEMEARRVLTLAKFAPVLDALPPDLRCEAEGYLEGRMGL